MKRIWQSGDVPLTLSTIVNNKEVEVTEAGLNLLRVSDLKILTSSLGLRSTGRKAEIISRILEFALTHPYEFVHLAPGSCFIDPPSDVDCQQLPVKISRSKKRKVNYIPFTGDPPYQYADCLCGGTPSGWPSPDVLCSSCSKNFHSGCMRWTSDKSFICPGCRIKALDPFCRPSRILWGIYFHRGSPAGELLPNSIWQIRCNEMLQNVPVDLDRENEDVVLLSVRVHCPKDEAKLKELEWPQRMDIWVNDHAEAISSGDAVKRRDSPAVLTPMLRYPNQSCLEADISADENRYGGPYFVCVALAKRYNVENIIGEIKERSENVESCQRRISDHINKLISKNDDEIEAVIPGITVKLTCPISLMKIEIPVRGRGCNHLQCFDLSSYLQVNKQTRVFNARWKCPECPLLIRPEDLLIDSVMLTYLSQYSDVDDIMINPDLTITPGRKSISLREEDWISPIDIEDISSSTTESEESEESEASDDIEFVSSSIDAASRGSQVVSVPPIPVSRPHSIPSSQPNSLSQIHFKPKPQQPFPLPLTTQPPPRPLTLATQLPPLPVPPSSKRHLQPITTTTTLLDIPSYQPQYFNQGMPYFGHPGVQVLSSQTYALYPGGMFSTSLISPYSLLHPIYDQSQKK